MTQNDRDQDQLEIIVCKGPSCSAMGADRLLAWCRDLQAAGLALTCRRSGCTGNCSESPVVQWNGSYVTEATPAKLTSKFIDENRFV